MRDKILEKPDGFTVVREEVTRIPDAPVVVLAVGPLVSDPLADDIARFTGKDHLYFFDESNRSLRRLPASGGPVEDVVTLEAPAGVGYGWPLVLPGGKGIIATAIPANQAQATQGNVKRLVFLDLDMRH